MKLLTSIRPAQAVRARQVLGHLIQVTKYEQCPLHASDKVTTEDLFRIALPRVGGPGDLAEGPCAHLRSLGRVFVELDDLPA
jgi:hypothetical protein